LTKQKKRLLGKGRARYGPASPDTCSRPIQGCGLLRGKGSAVNIGLRTHPKSVTFLVAGLDWVKKGFGSLCGSQREPWHTLFGGGIRARRGVRTSVAYAISTSLEKGHRGPAEESIKLKMPSLADVGKKDDKDWVCERVRKNLVVVCLGSRGMGAYGQDDGRVQRAESIVFSSSREKRVGLAKVKLGWRRGPPGWGMARVHG